MFWHAGGVSAQLPLSIQQSARRTKLVPQLTLHAAFRLALCGVGMKINVASRFTTSSPESQNLVL